MKKGVFISFEGVDGCGKTTISQKLAQRIRACNLEVELIREPGGTLLGEQIRELLLHRKDIALDYKAEALLFASSRAQLTSEIIIPTLQNGKIVISDRFIDSSLVYQSICRGLSFEDVYQLNSFAIGHVLPDITFFLDIDSSTRKQRLGERVLDRIEQDDTLSFEKISSAYQLLLDKFPERIIHIDAKAGEDEVFERVWEHLKKKYHEFTIT